MELNFRHSKLLADPVHLRAIHIGGQYGRFGRMSTAVTYFMHRERMSMIRMHFGSTNLSINRWPSHLRVNCKDGDRCYDFAREGFEGCTLSDAGYFFSPKRNFGGEKGRTTLRETNSGGLAGRCRDYR